MNAATPGYLGGNDRGRDLMTNLMMTNLMMRDLDAADAFENFG